MTSTWRPGSLSFLTCLLVLSMVVAPLGCWLGFHNSHLEEQGVDIVQHAYVLRCAATPGGWNETNLGNMTPYPQGSYYPAIALLPLFGDNPLLALRTTAWIAVLWMFAAQYTLLCRVFRPVPALAILFLWQVVALFGLMANINHVFCTQFNYSRVVGGASLWLALVFLTTPETVRWRRLLWQSLAVLAASYALLCHLAPGAIAFATLGAFGCLEWRHGRRDSVFLLILTPLAALGLMLTGDRLGMLNYASHPGDMLTGPLWLLLGWVPTWFIATVRECRAGRAGSVASVEQVLTAALIPSGLFQAYAAWKLMRDASCAAYSVNVLFFYTFSFASLLWFIWLGQFLERHEAGWSLRYPALLRRLRAYGIPVLIGALGVRLGYDYLAHERGLRDRITLRTPDGAVIERITLGTEFRPLRVTPQLATLGAEYQGQFYYYDPQQRYGAYYATMQGLSLPLPQAQRCMIESLDPATVDELLRDPAIKGVLLPHSANPHEVFRGSVVVEEVGSFWCCRAQ